MKTAKCLLLVCLLILIVASFAVRSPALSAEKSIFSQYPLDATYKGSGFSLSVPSKMPGGDRFYWPKATSDPKILALAENAYFLGITKEFKILLLPGCPQQPMSLEQATIGSCGTEAQFLTINSRRTGLCQLSAMGKTEITYLFPHQGCFWVLIFTCEDESAEKLSLLFANIAESFQINSTPKLQPT